MAGNKKGTAECGKKEFCGAGKQYGRYAKKSIIFLQMKICCGQEGTAQGCLIILSMRKIQQRMIRQSLQRVLMRMGMNLKRPYISTR